MQKHIIPVHYSLDARISRRVFIIGIATAATVAITDRGWAQGSSKRKPTVTIENFSPAGKSEGRVEVARVVKTDAEWRKQLSPLAFEVTRREGTETAGTGKYLNNHAAGIYRCICCETALFDSTTKFESGTGWPSFFRPISRFNVEETKDLSFGMVRIAVACTLCDAHIGHVFDDGPKPTGLRYCMNSVALHFVART